MHFATIIMTVIHLLMVGLLCWFVDENPGRFKPLDVFAAYFFLWFVVMMNSYYKLVLELMTDPDEAVKRFQQKDKE